MDYLQYLSISAFSNTYWDGSFKPYYKWITFNTQNDIELFLEKDSFKPYYKWITFNTAVISKYKYPVGISFKPYYKWITFNT